MIIFSFNYPLSFSFASSNRIIAQPKPCTYPTPTRESTSCCLSRCSTATAQTSASSSARGLKSSPSPPKRNSPSKTLTVSGAVHSSGGWGGGGGRWGANSATLIPVSFLNHSEEIHLHSSFLCKTWH